MTQAPDHIKAMRLDVVVMPNGEIICSGKTVGWVDKIGKYLHEMPAVCTGAETDCEYCDMTPCICTPEEIAKRKKS